MQTLFILFLGALAGLHAACYGAYKDSPYEKFKINRFLREIAIGIGISIFSIYLYPPAFSIHPGILFLTFLAFSRIITEFYKLIIRKESQKNFKIPTMVHVFRKVLYSNYQRLAIGTGISIILILSAILAQKIYTFFPFPINGGAIGLLMGTLTALGGSYKDGFFEGFSIRKFFRSPIIGALSGIILVYKTTNPTFLFFAACGMERMIVEFYKGFVKANYVPGKFKAEKAYYPEYFDLRKRLILPYILTWIFFLYLFWN